MSLVNSIINNTMFEPLGSQGYARVACVGRTISGYGVFGTNFGCYEDYPGRSSGLGFEGTVWRSATCVEKPKWTRLALNTNMKAEVRLQLLLLSRAKCNSDG